MFVRLAQERGQGAGPILGSDKVQGGALVFVGSRWWCEPMADDAIEVLEQVSANGDLALDTCAALFLFRFERGQERGYVGRFLSARFVRGEQFGHGRMVLGCT